ncbi:MAG: M23 family metallopeptidase [Devosia nanyangense]|uniref:M23 family metallopeptidase n=1 Tax=Devosia nanyangense TaxID=1228055 RepID=A0A933KYG4_9HYPH|nr:M23 family metallopeptidase [Devosia nanyangense]
MFYLGFAGLLATNVLTLVGLLMAPDLARLFTSENETVLAAYEDRVSQLRLEVDRLQSRHYAQAGDINLQLQELAQTQEVLVEQHQYVRQLVDKAAALGIATASLSGPEMSAEASRAPLLTGSITSGGSASADVAAAAASITAMMNDSRLALAALSEQATSKTDEIMGTLAGIGIRPKLPTFDDSAEGGPLLPPVDGLDSPSLVDDANSVAEALERFRAARDAADLAPIHKPLTAATRVSSIFGNRKDPFTGRLAFHSGIDFAAPRGSNVLSAGHGRVSFVGQISGYGNVVEVTHGNGLITRYAHLSAFLITEGATVDAGTPLARVGSTGRSTGPHLHFEIRRSDTAVDPTRYLNAGRILTKILAT